MSIQNEPIQTYARLKPIFPTEEQILYKKNICTLTNKNNDYFSFDNVFDAETSNQQVYDQTTRKFIEQSFRGFNSCILAYGQTSSGKTYTMKGTHTNPGIIPLSLKDIFKKIENEKLTAKVDISYIEIYNEDIIDLLGDRQNSIVQPREDQKKNLILSNLKQFTVSTEFQAMQLFQKGEQRRKFGTNNLNINSSRSHTIFRIYLRLPDENLNQIFSQINLVDLAGSQGIQRTKAQKITKLEGENINKSILALTRVIKSMSEKEAQFISFRESKLTRILQKSLCENSKSSIICTVNPTIINYQQCINTLKFGQMAAKIKIQARQNTILTEQLKKQQLSFRNVQLFPSEKMELEEARVKICQNEKKLIYYESQIKQYEQILYAKDEQIYTYERIFKDLNDQLQNKKKADDNNRNEWWKQRQMLENRITNYQEEIDSLERTIEKFKTEKKELQKKEKTMAENLQFYENQCRNLNNQLLEIKAKIDEQNSRPMRPLATVSVKKVQKPVTIKNNPFQLPAYQQSDQRISPSKLQWIVKLKIQVIDLVRQVNQYTKANIEIAEENQEQRRKIEQLEERLSKERSSGKINPESLQYNQIRKLNNKIKTLKAELKRYQQRQRKNREIIKKQKKIQQFQQFSEYYNKKYTKDYLLDKQTQTEHVQMESHHMDQFISMSPIFDGNQNINGPILEKNRSLIEYQNPQEKPEYKRNISLDGFSQKRSFSKEKIGLNFNSFAFSNSITHHRENPSSNNQNYNHIYSSGFENLNQFEGMRSKKLFNQLSSSNTRSIVQNQNKGAESTSPRRKRGSQEEDLEI